MEAESRAPEAWPGAEHRSSAGRRDTGLGVGVSEARDTGRWRFLELWAAQAGFPSHLKGKVPEEYTMDQHAQGELRLKGKVPEEYTMEKRQPLQ